MFDKLAVHRLAPPTLRFDYENRRATHSNPFKGLMDHGPYDLFERRQKGSATVSAVLVGRSDKRAILKTASEALVRRRLGRLHDAFRIEIEATIEVPASAPKDEAKAYRDAITSWLREHGEKPRLAFVLHHGREQYRRRASPYFASKAAFLSQGIPTQSVRYESIEGNVDKFERYYLANILTACYAKIGGIPWVVAPGRDSQPEVTVGVAAAAVRSEGRDERFVGISTIFAENGAFVLWDTTPLQESLDDYQKSLEAGIVKAIRAYEQMEGREVRRVACHVSGKRAGFREITAVRQALERFEEREIEAAIVHVTSDASLWLLDGATESLRPQPGVVSLLRYDGSQALLSTESGKTSQFVSQPLKLELAAPKGGKGWFDTYEHIHQLRWMSWRSVRPSSQPVSVLYPQKMASLLANLHKQEEVGALDILPRFKNQAWFL